MDLDRRALRLALLLLREDRGWTQEQASQASGVRRASFSDYEAGKAAPKRNLGKILAAFEVAPADFEGLLESLRHFLDRVASRPQLQEPLHRPQDQLLAEAVRAADQSLHALFDALLGETKTEEKAGPESA